MTFLPKVSLNSKASIEECVMDSLAVFQRNDAQIAGAGFAGSPDLSPKAQSPIRLLLPVERRGNNLNAPRQFDVGPLAADLLIRSSASSSRRSIPGALKASPSAIVSELKPITPPAPMRYLLSLAIMKSGSSSVKP